MSQKIDFSLIFTEYISLAHRVRTLHPYRITPEDVRTLQSFKKLWELTGTNFEAFCEQHAMLRADVALLIGLFPVRPKEPAAAINSI